MCVDLVELQRKRWTVKRVKVMVVVSLLDIDRLVCKSGFVCASVCVWQSEL